MTAYLLAPAKCACFGSSHVVTLLVISDGTNHMDGAGVLAGVYRDEELLVKRPESGGYGTAPNSRVDMTCVSQETLSRSNYSFSIDLPSFSALLLLVLVLNDAVLSPTFPLVFASVSTF